MARYRKSNGFGCLFFIIIFLIFGVVSLINTIAEEQAAIDNRKYHNTMAALENPESVPVRGDKIVTYLTDLNKKTDPMFSKEYIPDGYETNDPEEVRYILHCSKGASMVGTYSNGGGAGFRHWVEVELVDRRSGSVLGSSKFEGGYPPSSVRTSGAHYGSEPDSGKITDWVRSCISTAANSPVTQKQTVTVYVQVPASWNTPGCWAWSSVTKEDAFAQWPGKSMKKDGNWYSVSVPSWVDSLVINGNNGDTQTADLSISSGKDVWVVVKSPSKVEISY